MSSNRRDSIRGSKPWRQVPRSFHLDQTYYANTVASPADRIIKLVVGSEKAILSVHAGVLSASSAFFENALKPSWMASDTIELSDDSVDAVTLYVSWAYQKAIYVPDNGTRDAHFFNKLTSVLVHAYIFGEKVTDVEFKNDVLGDLILALDEFNTYPPTTLMILAYEKTPSESPLRRLIADFSAYTAHEKVTSLFNAYPKELLFDIVETMAKVRTVPKTRPWSLSKEEYYEKTSPQYIKTESNCS